MRKSEKKRILSLLLAVCFCVMFSVTAYARYINEIEARSELTESNGKAVMYSSVYAATDVTKIEISHVLQKKSGSRYTDVPNTATTPKIVKDNSASIENTVSFTGTGTYRVKMTCKVTSPNGTDTHYEYSKDLVH